MSEDKTDHKIEVEKTVLKEGLEAEPESAKLDAIYKSAVDGNARKARARDPRFKMYDYDINPEHGWFVSLAISFFLFSMGALMCLFLYSSMVCWPWQNDWIPVEGQVIKISNHTKTSARFTYNYKADNQTITGFMSKPGSLEHTLKVGSKVTVRYNPKKVFESYLQGGFNIIETPFYALVALSFFVTAFVYSTGAIIRAFRKR
ncbi:MAG: hypothetical protein C0507_05415 [Cyanobacteria bacterium PR.3.49]|nr:hypothetical protein [Cyanobacteria bacterium PR.3.49]